MHEEVVTEVMKTGLRASAFGLRLSDCGRIQRVRLAIQKHSGV